MNEALEALERIYSRASCLSAQEDSHNDNDQIIVTIALSEVEKLKELIREAIPGMERYFDELVPIEDDSEWDRCFDWIEKAKEFLGEEK